MRMVFVLNTIVILMGNATDCTLERTVAKQGMRAKADVFGRYPCMKVYAIIPKSNREAMNWQK